MLMYVDDTKYLKSIKLSSDAASLLEDLSSPSKRSKDWCLSLSNKNAIL